MTITTIYEIVCDYCSACEHIVGARNWREAMRIIKTKYGWHGSLSDDLMCTVCQAEIERDK